MRPNELWTRPHNGLRAARARAQGKTGRGGTSAIRNRGCVPFGLLVMKPRDRDDSKVSVKSFKTEQNTRLT